VPQANHVDSPADVPGGDISDVFVTGLLFFDLHPALRSDSDLRRDYAFLADVIPPM